MAEFDSRALYTQSQEVSGGQRDCKRLHKHGAASAGARPVIWDQAKELGMRWFGWLRGAPKTSAQHDDDRSSLVAMRGGRLRARGVAYQLPRDLEEMNRLDFQHYIFRQILQGNYGAPIGSPQSILDVGTGTGRWAREMAALFPSANVVGVDIAAPPTDDAADGGAGPELRPTNYTFVAANVLEGLPFPDGAFDYTHMRLMVLAIPHDHWPAMVNELIRVTRIGGWIESVEVATTDHGGPAMERLNAWGPPILALRGIQLAAGARVGELFQGAGLANVRTHVAPLPLGEYGGRIGKMQAANFVSGAKAMRGVIVDRGVVSAAEYDATLQQAIHDLASSQRTCVMPIYVAYGQRAR